MNTELADIPTEAVRLGDTSHRRSLRGAARDIAGDRTSRGVFALTALVVGFAYSLLLPFDYTQRVSFRNWQYLSAYLLIWAIVLGVGMGVVVSVQVYAMRRIVRARTSAGVAGGIAFVGSLLPSFLCCTPIIPTVLSFVGVSGVGLYGTTGTLQHFFATHQTEFLAGSLALLVLTSWWGLRKVAAAACLVGTACDPGLGCDVARWPDRQRPAKGRPR